MEPQQMDEIDAILDDLRTRCDETPQWEFCDGFLAALVCCRRTIALEEVLEVLLGIGSGEDAEAPAEASFADAAQKERFLTLWNLRQEEIRVALDTPVESLDDDAAYHPEVTDVRAAIASLSEAERAEMADAPVPSFGQVWALGFMYAIEAWSEEWTAPRDKKAAQWLDASLLALVAMTEDDTAPPEISPFTEGGPATLSAQRLNAFADAVWAVYDLRELWRGIGPRIATVHRTDTPGRNDLCHCGSGKKYKKCHGA